MVLSQQLGYRRADGSLRIGAIKTECRSDASDHIGRQELHNERDEIDGHGLLLSIIELAQMKKRPRH